MTKLVMFYVFWNDITKTIIIGIAIDVCPILQLSRPFTENHEFMTRHPCSGAKGSVHFPGI